MAPLPATGRAAIPETGFDRPKLTRALAQKSFPIRMTREELEPGSSLDFPYRNKVRPVIVDMAELARPVAIDPCLCRHRFSVRPKRIGLLKDKGHRIDARGALVD